MGQVVVHLEKAKGSDSGMSAHIERTIAPKNADETRTHLNREFIEFPDGVENRTQAIQHRLDTAGLTRKIGTNQVRAARVMLSGTHEDMAEIENSGRLDEWCSDNLDWLRQTFGADNVVSAVLHLDEKTPHIHATVVPIVPTERVKRKREENVKKTYRKKKPSARLCCDEVMGRLRLEKYQDDYAIAMAKYGLKRGRRGSDARHKSTAEHYKDLQEQSESIQENITELLEQQATAEKELSATKSDISKEKLKNSAADVGSMLLDGASSLFGTSKVKRIEAENKELTAQVQTLQAQATNDKHTSEQRYNKLKSEFEQQENGIKAEIATLKEKITKIFNLFPNIPELLNLEKFLIKVGFPIEMIQRLFNREEVKFSGNVYSHEYGRRFETKNSVARLAPDKERDNRPSLVIDNLDHIYWFRHKKNEELKAMGHNITETRQRRGLKR